MAFSDILLPSTLFLHLSPASSLPLIMPRQTPDPQTLFHLVPDKNCTKAAEMLLHPDNDPFVSPCKDANDVCGLEIGYHVPIRPRPLVIVEVGKNADLIMPGASISQVHFAFEIHPESRQIMFLDRSRFRNTKIAPVCFRPDGHFRQVVLQPGTQYTVSAGGEKTNLYVFHWIPESPRRRHRLQNNAILARS